MSKLPPLYPVRKGGVSNMEPVLSFIVAVAAGVVISLIVSIMAGVISHLICKWLDRNK